jgi:choline monooxygenase
MKAEYGMPSLAYADGSWFETERKTLFAQSWMLAGCAQDAPEAGDYFTFDAGSAPLAIIRGKDGALRAFHNLCRHRGATILEGKGRLQGGIKCFYHAWAYGLDGALIAVPQPEQFPGLDKRAFGLKPAALAEFRGMVFVHRDPGAQSGFAEWLGAFPDHFGPFDLSHMTLVASDAREIKANWKLFVENHIDGYHLYHLHRDSVLGYDHDAQRHFFHGDHWSFFEPWATEGHLPEFERRIPGRVISQNDKWKQSSVHMLFPNLCIATGAKWVALLSPRPVAPDRSVIESRFFIVPQTGPDAERYFSPPDGRTSEGFDVIAEDVTACERIQAGVASPAFQVGPLAQDFEISIAHFHRAILRHMQRKE